MDRYWKRDRISAFEAPHETADARKTRDVALVMHGQKSRSTSVTVRVPADMKMPDLITWHGHTFARRTDERYSEASMWPIVEELDG